MKTVLTAAAVFLIFTVSAYAETVEVITKKNSIREECKFFAKVVATVNEGFQLEVVSMEGDWLRVRFDYGEGCIHKSAVEEKKVTLGGLLGAFTPGGTSEDEVSLAGKGFNPQVEGSYKLKNPELRYSLVDRVEGYEVSTDRLRSFMDDGGLRLP
jgi:hypothetical protein